MEFFASVMHPSLLHMMDVGLSYMYPTSTKSFLSQSIFFVQWLVVIYSASHVDNAMVRFLHFHEMIPMPIRNKYLVVDLMSFAFLAQSALQNPLEEISLPLRHNLKSKVPFKYPMMRFAAIQCGGSVFNMNWLIVLTTNAISALVTIITYMKDPTLALYGTLFISLYTFSNSSAESFNNFEFASNEVPTSLHSSMLKRLITSSM